MFKYLLVILFLFSSFRILLSNGSAGTDADFESRFIVDMPNAGLLAKGIYSIKGIAMHGGGIQLSFDAAPFRDFNIGISYSGANIIGSGKVVWQGLPGINIRWRIKNETISYPALLLGFSNQGSGNYLDQYDRFEVFSPGLFLTASKNYKWALGTIAVHAGCNYTLDRIHKNPLNIFFGFEHSLGAYASFNAEYNCNFDEYSQSVMSQRGLMNIAIQIAPFRNLTFGLYARDLLGNYQNSSGILRAFGCDYINSF